MVAELHIERVEAPQGIQQIVRNAQRASSHMSRQDMESSG